MLDGNKYEQAVFERYPSLSGKIVNLKHNDVYQIDDDFEMKCLYTPGHTTDHFSLLMNPKTSYHDQAYLFSGDIILGTPSTSV
jgi:glyoxylase-like metal-dependent hydrolase (beta-lactamase superfamily II)